MPMMKKMSKNFIDYGDDDFRVSRSLPLHTDLKGMIARLLLRFQQLQTFLGRTALCECCILCKHLVAIFFTGTPSDGTSYSICSHCFQSKVKASVVGLYDCESLCACRKKQTHQDTRRAQHGKAGAEGGSE